MDLTHWLLLAAFLSSSAYAVLVRIDRDRWRRLAEESVEELAKIGVDVGFVSRGPKGCTFGTLEDSDTEREKWEGKK